MSFRRLIPCLLILCLQAPVSAEEAVRGFVNVEPFEFRLEALVQVSAYRESWQMTGDSIGSTEKKAVLDRCLALLEKGVTVGRPGSDLTFTEQSVRFIVPDPEKGFRPDEREIIPISEALVGLTLSSSAPGVVAFEIDWRWFAPGQEKLVLEIASRGKPSARILTPSETRVKWTLDGAVDLPSLQPVPAPQWLVPSILTPSVVVGLALIGGAVGVALRRRPGSAAWAAGLLVAGIAISLWGLRSRTPRLILPTATAVEDLVYALLRNTYHAFDFRDESAIYDTLEASVTGPLLEQVYLEMRSSLELENAGGPRVRVYEIALRECQEVLGGERPETGFTTRAEWVTIGEVTHWGHTHERTNRYEAEISLASVEDTWKISGLELLNEERVQKVSRQAAPTEP